MQNIQSPIVRRNMLEGYRSRFIGDGLDASDIRPVILVMVVALAANKQSYDFFTNDGTQVFPVNSNFERLLGKNDAAFIDSLALGILPCPTLNSVLVPANADVIFYPDPDIFTGAAVANTNVSEADALKTLYNGMMDFKTDQDTRMDRLATAVFKSTPTTQATGSTQGASYEQIPFYDLTSAFGVFGDVNNKITVNLGYGDYTKIAGVAGTRNNYAVLYAQGFEFKGAAKSQRLINAIKAPRS